MLEASQCHHLWGSTSDDGKVVIDPDDAQHAIKSLRLKPGDHVVVIDGSGTATYCELTSLSRKNVTGKRCHSLPDYGKVAGDLHIAMAPTKQMDRMHVFIEKAIEMGVHAITPLICYHSERRHVPINRILRVAKAACKQSQKGHMPTIHEAIPFTKFLQQHDESRRLAMAICLGDRQDWGTWLQSDKATTLLIGPEGDFSDDEWQLADKQGAEAVSLGDHRLRTETAGLLAVAQYAGKLSAS